MWKNIGTKPVDTLGRLSVVEECGDTCTGRCECYIGLGPNQFEYIIAETKTVDWNKSVIELRIEFAARSIDDQAEPISIGTHPIIGWQFYIGPREQPKK